MNPLPSILDQAGDAALRSLLAGSALVAFDFDGTLAPIVEHPPHARLPLPVETSLRELAGLTRLVVISGRSLKDLRERAAIGAFRLIGNHGNDDQYTDPLAAARAHAVCRRWRHALEQEIRRRLGDHPGVEVEDKGTTLSVHYRHAPDPLAAVEPLSAITEGLEPKPRVIGGKFVLNLLPPGSQTKFEALRQLADDIGTRRVLFVGDDDTDEIAFARAPADWLTVRVEPGEHSAARFALATQEDVARLIERLLELLRHPDRPGGASDLRSS